MTIICGITSPACSANTNDQSRRASGKRNAGPRPTTGTPFIPYDIQPLLKPKQKFIGAAIDGAPQSAAVLNRFSRLIGKKVNMVTIYSSTDDDFDSSGARNAWATGAVPLIMWEPFKHSLSALASGQFDDHLRDYAQAVRALNIPIAISFGHEMNGFWYPWGTKSNSSADFVRAWRHIHKMFSDAGAANVIWIWNPNVINPVPQVPLKPFYPGDDYVDWIGLIGYYTLTGAATFSTLYGPTTRQIRRFTHKPFIITETASQPGARSARDVADLLNGVASSPDFIGFVWFNHLKRADWRLITGTPALAEFRRRIAADSFGFDPAKP